MYDYLNAMVADIADVADNYDWDFSAKDVAEQMYDDLWVEDSVTGNDSGMYATTNEEAKTYLSGNDGIIREAVSEFCIDAETITEKFMNEDYSYFDVTVRCYLLGQAIDKFLSERLDK